MGKIKETKAESKERHKTKVRTALECASWKNVELNTVRVPSMYDGLGHWQYRAEDTVLVLNHVYILSHLCYHDLLPCPKRVSSVVKINN
jgi:hypothetical protein